jgi:serine/threonine protein kinase/regulator of sirC expression with transglutaminase-like and TPR domain
VRAIAGYEILSEVGRGAMGVVYRAHSPKGEEVALKVVALADGERRARFDRERRLLGSFTAEEGFVPLLDSGTTPQAAYLVMPFLGEGTLRQRLVRGPLPVAEALAIGRALAQALGRAHARGVVHRDVKPENVLFASGRPLLADLGLAKHFDPTAAGASQSRSLTVDGSITGTAGYMAPEQTADARRVAPPADVFSLGAVLYECLAGRPAFVAPTVLEVLARVCSGVVEPIDRPGVPAWLEAVVLRALSFDPNRRFADGAAFARALEGASQARSRGPLLLAGALVGAVALGAALLLGRGIPPSSAPPESPAPSQKPPAPPPGTDMSAETRRKAAVEALERGLDDLSKGRIDEAIADFDRVIELEPGAPAGWTHRGKARATKGDPGALADFDKAVELGPRNAAVWLCRSVARRRLGDTDGAVADAAQALVQDPLAASGFRELAYAVIERHENDAAIALAARAIELEPTDPSCWAARGVAYVNRNDKGDNDRGLADGEKVLALDPTLPDGWKIRGWARGRKGDYDGGISDLEHYLEIGPHDRFVANVQRKIAQLRAARDKK